MCGLGFTFGDVTLLWMFFKMRLQVKFCNLQKSWNFYTVLVLRVLAYSKYSAIMLLWWFMNHVFDIVSLYEWMEYTECILRFSNILDGAVDYENLYYKLLLYSRFTLLLPKISFRKGLFLLYHAHGHFRIEPSGIQTYKFGCSTSEVISFLAWVQRYCCYRSIWIL